MVVCDTNIFISLFSGHLPTIQALQKIGSEKILLPSLVVMELVRGMNTKRDLNAMNKKLKNYNLIHIQQSSSIIAMTLLQNFKLSHNLEIPDAIIAAICIDSGLPLFTYNAKDFQFIPGLKLYKV